MEYTEEMDGYGLMGLLQKCTRLRSLFITYDENNFENFDFSLLCNLTELSIGHLNDTEAYLRSVMKHCKRLQRFRLHFNTLWWARFNEFCLCELTVQLLPELKILASFGVSQMELEQFCLMRPKVEIVEPHLEFDHTIFCMKW